MALLVQLSDGTQNIDLIFDAASQPNFAANYGYRVQHEETVVARHRPDAATPQPVSGYDLPSSLFLTMDVKGLPDTRLNKIAELKRWVDGADQQALRHAIVGDVDKITLTIQIPNATNATTYTVRWGFVDDGTSYYTAAADLNSRTRAAVVMVRLEPYGEGAEITLRNDLASSPHMIQDSNGAGGVADGMNPIAGFGNPVLDTTTWLIGGQSQRMDFADVGPSGFQTAAATPAATTDDAVAYVWIASSGKVITMELIDGSGNIYVTRTHTPANPQAFDFVVAGSDGTLWYRYSMTSYTTRTSSDLRLKIYNDSSGTGKMWIDGLYLQVEPNGTAQPVPDGWASTANIFNRYDPTQANTERINYIDTWGIPGDSLALGRWELEAISFEATGTPASYIVSALRDGLAQAAQIKYWHEGEDGTGQFPSFDWSTVALAGRSNGAFEQFSFVGGGHIHFDVDTKFALQPWRVFAVVRASDLATTFELYDSDIAGKVRVLGEPVSVTRSNDWQPIDLGLINPVGQMVSDYDLQNSAGSFSIFIQNVSGTSGIDFVFFISAQYDESPMFLKTDDNISGVQVTGESLIINGPTLESSISNIGRNIPAQNFIQTIQHGRKMQRTIFSTHNDLYDLFEQWELTDNFKVTLTVTPRTRQLLGTQ